MPTEYNWKLITVLHSGHRIFLDENTGSLAIADNSGPTPDTTDDGVLWLSKNPMALLTFYDNSPAVEIITNPQPNLGWVLSNFDSVPQLSGMGFKLVCSDSFYQHLNLWRQVTVLLDAQAVSVKEE